MSPITGLACEQVETELDDFLDGELPPERMRAVARHLAACSACREQVSFETQIVGELKRRLRGVTAPPDLRTRVREALQEGCARFSRER